MPRRMEIELTSARPDGTWTWRAAGAREPRGVVEGGLLTSDAKVGDIVKVEADVDLEGISILNVIVDRGHRSEPERLELLGSQQPFEPVVTTLAARSRTERPPRRDRPPRPGDGAGDDRRARPRREPGNRGDKGPGRDGRTAGPREPAPAGQSTGERPARQPRPQRTRTPRPPRPPREVVAAEPKPKAKRLRAGRVHRKALLAGLPPEQVPVAEQLFAGGLPAVRQAIATQNETLKAEGKPEVPAKSLLALAEQMLPQVRAAEWRDRADAALADVDEIDLRDLRSVVGADDAARDEESRAIASQLREALTTRVEKEHSAWLDEIGTALDEARIVRALRLSTRPPKAGARFPAPLASRLTEAAGAALHATATTDRWVAVLEAIAFSPVRSSVIAVSVPDPIPDDLKAVVARSAGALPQIAAQFGIEPPAVTGPPKPRRPMPPRRPAKPAAQGARPAAAAAPATPATATPATADAPVEAVPEPAAETAPAAEVEAAPEPAAEAAPVEAPDAPVEAPEPAAVEPTAPSAPAVDEAPTDPPSEAAVPTDQPG